MMKRFLNYSLVVALAFGLSMVAHAAPGGNGNGNGDGNGHDNPNNPHTAPEVDPGLTAAGLALLGGTITILRARRRK
jgi:LPXTG-motif cell wall-anchored protein